MAERLGTLAVRREGGAWLEEEPEACCLSRANEETLRKGQAEEGREGRREGGEGGRVGGRKGENFRE